MKEKINIVRVLSMTAIGLSVLATSTLLSFLLG